MASRAALLAGLALALPACIGVRAGARVALEGGDSSFVVGPSASVFYVTNEERAVGGGVEAALLWGGRPLFRGAPTTVVATAFGAAGPQDTNRFGPGTFALGQFGVGGAFEFGGELDLHLAACGRYGFLPASLSACARWTPDEWVGVDVDASANPVMLFAVY